jgi:hypothetical protein
MVKFHVLVTAVPLTIEPDATTHGSEFLRKYIRGLSVPEVTTPVGSVMITPFNTISEGHANVSGV